MQPSLHVVIATLIACSHAGKVTNPNKVPKNAVLLSDVNSLTLRAGKQTAGRRSSPVPQLQCVGPANVCKLFRWAVYLSLFTKAILTLRQCRCHAVHQ
jgi:hypothetical protein